MSIYHRAGSLRQHRAGSGSNLLPSFSMPFHYRQRSAPVDTAAGGDAGGHHIGRRPKLLMIRAAIRQFDVGSTSPWCDRNGCRRVQRPLLHLHTGQVCVFLGIPWRPEEARQRAKISQVRVRPGREPRPKASRGSGLRRIQGFASVDSRPVRRQIGAGSSQALSLGPSSDNGIVGRIHYVASISTSVNFVLRILVCPYTPKPKTSSCFLLREPVGSRRRQAARLLRECMPVEERRQISDGKFRSPAVSGSRGAR